MAYTNLNFPNTRLRRLRTDAWLRDLVAENHVTVKDLIYPLFVHDDAADRLPVGSMPGVSRLSLKALVQEAKRAASLGIPAIAVFPAIDPARKDANGTEALNAENIVCRAIKEVKDACPDLGLICDVALDPFTDHGHDGLMDSKTGKILNDATVEVLCRQAVMQAAAGCDILAPSDMMDGRIGAIRKALDESGFVDNKILSYAAKYASAFYGPFRDAVGSSALVGKDRELGFRDKRGYQMNPANSAEALREVAMDLNEGADIVMVKPGLPYLDILYRVKQEFQVPTFVYQVSGEYAAIKFAAANNAIDEKKGVMEALLSFKRAGADAILSYFSADVAEWLS